MVFVHQLYASRLPLTRSTAPGGPDTALTFGVLRMTIDRAVARHALVVPAEPPCRRVISNKYEGWAYGSMRHFRV